MVEYLKWSEETESNKLGILTETVLPYVNNNLENMNMKHTEYEGCIWKYNNWY